MSSNYKKLGKYIQPVNIRNTDLMVETLLGVSINKVLMPSIANTVGTNMKTYKVIKRNQFAYGPVTSRNGDKISVALLEDHDEAIVSQAYTVFEVKDETELNPEYLMMWMRRPEFDRYARFKSHGSAREVFDWDEMCETELPIPSPEKQNEIVTEYNTVKNRITLNNQLIQKLEETAQAIYKQWFVDFEFTDENGKPYKSSGGKMVWSEELDKEIPVRWEVNTLDIVSNCFDGKRRPLSELERQEIKGVFPYYGAMGIVDHINNYMFDGIHLLFSEDGVNVVNKKGNPSLQYIWGKFWVNNHAHVLTGKGDFTTEILTLALKNTNVSHLVTGAAQPKINQKNMNSIEILTPPEKTLIEIQKLIKPFFENIQIYKEQVSKMHEMLVLLLSKLATIEN